MRLLRELSKLRSEERDAMARLDTRLERLLGDFPAGPIAHGTLAPRSGKTPSPQEHTADRAAERRRSPPDLRESSRPSSRRLSPVGRVSPELSADEGRNERPERSSSPERGRPERLSTSKRRSAKDLVAAAEGRREGKKEGDASGEGPSPATRESSRRSPVNGDPLPGKKVDGWKKGMPSCGVASGAAKSERKHSVRAAQAPQGPLEPNAIPDPNRHPLPDPALPLACAHLAQSRAGDRDLAARLAVHLAAGGQGGPGLAHGEPRRPGPPGLLGAYSCCSPYSLFFIARCGVRVRCACC